MGGRRRHESRLPPPPLAKQNERDGMASCFEANVDQLMGYTRFNSLDCREQAWAVDVGVTTTTSPPLHAMHVVLLLNKYHAGFQVWSNEQVPSHLHLPPFALTFLYSYDVIERINTLPYLCI